MEIYEKHIELKAWFMARGKGIPPCKAAELETGKSARLFKKPPAKIWVGGGNRLLEC